MRRKDFQAVLLLLLTVGCSAGAPTSQLTKNSAVPKVSPLPESGTVTGPHPNHPDLVLYEDSLNTLHAGYLTTLVRANGKPLAADEHLSAGNAVQLRGNSYVVERVSLFILRNPP